MDLSFLYTSNLSWAAKGLYCWLLTQEQGTPVDEALEISKDPEELKAALEELSSIRLLSFDTPTLDTLLGDGRIHEA
jgi:hypothetical protein